MNKSTARTLVLSSALVVLLAGVAAPAAAAPAPSRELDGPGRYVLFRTMPAAADPSEAQDAGCDEHFGPQAPLTVRQAALSYAPKVDRATGLAVDETATYIGPSYICAGPAAGTDLIEAYGSADLPMGSAEGDGPCEPSLVGIVRLAPFIACRLALRPVPSLDSPGGYLVGNSVSGSIIIGYLVRESNTPLPNQPPGPEPEDSPLPNDPDFYVWRDFGGRTSADACPVPVTGARTTTLSATQPESTTGLLNPRERLSGVGTVTLCFTGGDGARRDVLAVADIRRAGTTARVYAQGDCRDAPLAGNHPDLLVQTCTLGVLWADSPVFRAGQFTSIGLVRADKPLVAANSHIWSLGILDGETEGGPLPVPAP